MSTKHVGPEGHAHRVLERARVTRLPVSLSNIARLYQVRVQQDDLEDDASGYLIRDQGRALIVVRRAESRERQRFTIAHELGHLVMHRGRPLLVDGDVRINERLMNAEDFASPEEESQANRFAAALLMPDEMIKAELARIPAGHDVVRDLAKISEVSVAAMQYRLTNLGLLMPPADREDAAKLSHRRHRNVKRIKAK